MTRPAAVVLCLLIAATLTQAARLRRSAALELTASPGDAVETETGEVVVSCQPPALDDLYLAIVLFISHKGADGGSSLIAQVLPSGPAIMATGNITQRLSAEGSLEEPVALTVTLSEPQVSDSGDYSCRFVYMDNEFNINTMTADTALNVEAPNVTVPVVEMVVEPEVVIPVEVFEEEEICNCSTIRAELQEEINEIKDSLLIQKAELRALMAQKPVVAPVITAAGVDVRCQASFSVRLSARGIPLEDGSRIPFNQAISNNGDNFNTGSNVFVAPCDGQYYFSLTLRSYQYMDSGSVEAAIVVGDVSKARTNVFIDYSRAHYETAGVSTVLSLSEGDEVKAVVSTNSMGQVMGGEYSVFSGFYLF